MSSRNSIKFIQLSPGQNLSQLSTYLHMTEGQLYASFSKGDKDKFK